MSHIGFPKHYSHVVRVANNTVSLTLANGRLCEGCPGFGLSGVALTIEAS